MSEDKKGNGGDTNASGFALMVRRAANLPESWTDERIAVVKRTVAPEEAGPAEVAMFLAVCAHYDLDPFVREAWLVKDKGRLIIVTGRDSFLKVARRDERYRGFEADVVHAKDTFKAVHQNGEVIVVHEINGFDRGELLGAYCVARQEGRPAILITRRFDQYKHLHHKENWKNYPADMLLARVITAAHRLGYNISGLYTPEEIDNGEAHEELAGHEVAQKTRQRLEELKADLMAGAPPAEAEDADYEIVEEGSLRREEEKPTEVPAAAEAPAAPEADDDSAARAKARGRFWKTYTDRGYDQDSVEQEKLRHAWLEEHFGKRSFAQLTTAEIRAATKLLESGDGPAKVDGVSAAAGAEAGGGMPA